MVSEKKKADLFSALNNAHNRGDEIENIVEEGKSVEHLQISLRDFMNTSNDDYPVNVLMTEDGSDEE